MSFPAASCGVSKAGDEFTFAPRRGIFDPAGYKEVAMTKYRVGLILPSVNIHMEPEFYRLRDILPDINHYSTRVFLTDTTAETLVEMEKDWIMPLA